MLERGFFKEALRALEESVSDTDMLLRCVGNEGTAFLALILSTSELASLKFSVCNDGDCDRGGVGHGCKPPNCDNPGTKANSVDCSCERSGRETRCLSLEYVSAALSFSASDATDSMT